MWEIVLITYFVLAIPVTFVMWCCLVVGSESDE